MWLYSSSRDMYLKWSGVDFINVFMRSFYEHRYQKHKKLLDLIVFLRFEDLLEEKLRIIICIWNDQVGMSFRFVFVSFWIDI